MKPALDKRLQALEARAPKADPEHDRRYSEAVKAMFDTVNHRNEWAPSKVAPFNWVEEPSDLERLAARIEAGNTTEADNALMSAWPKCHLEPVQLVGMLARLMSEI